jgi:ABC-type transporter Mla subunit MlaD
MVKQIVTNETAATAAQETAVTPESVVESVRALRAQIPNYVQLPIPTARTLQAVAALNTDFTQAAINAVGASETVQATIGQSAEELQAAVDATARWSMVRDELKATLDGVTSAVLTMKHTLGQSVLLTYTVSKKLVKVPQHANLLPHVALMRKTNRLGRNRKAQPETPAPAPNPTPAPHV